MCREIVRARKVFNKLLIYIMQKGPQALLKALNRMLHAYNSMTIIIITRILPKCHIQEFHSVQIINLFFVVCIFLY